MAVVVHPASVTVRVGFTHEVTAVLAPRGLLLPVVVSMVMVARDFVHPSVCLPRVSV